MPKNPIPDLAAGRRGRRWHGWRTCGTNGRGRAADRSLRRLRLEGAQQDQIEPGQRLLGRIHGTEQFGHDAIGHRWWKIITAGRAGKRCGQAESAARARCGFVAVIIDNVLIVVIHTPIFRYQKVGNGRNRINKWYKMLLNLQKYGY